MNDEKKSSFRILVIDDEASIRISLAGFLEDYEYEVVTAESAEEALELIQNVNVDAAVVDLRLSGKSGETFICEARDLFPAMKFIIHTGSVDYRISNSVKKAGVEMEDLLLKPLADLNEMVKALKRLLE